MVLCLYLVDTFLISVGSVIKEQENEEEEKRAKLEF